MGPDMSGKRCFVLIYKAPVGGDRHVAAAFSFSPGFSSVRRALKAFFESDRWPAPRPRGLSPKQAASTIMEHRDYEVVELAMDEHWCSHDPRDMEERPDA